MASSIPPTLDQAIKEITELSDLLSRLPAKAQSNVIRLIGNKIRSLRSVQATHRDLLNRLINLNSRSEEFNYHKAVVDEVILGVTDDMLAEDGVGHSNATKVCRRSFASLQNPTACSIANDRCS